MYDKLIFPRSDKQILPLVDEINLEESLVNIISNSIVLFELSSHNL